MSDKTQEETLNERLKGAGQAGSGGRSNALGANDPRHRRGAQTESLPAQRFDPADFTVDSEQRVSLVKAVTDAEIETDTEVVSTLSVIGARLTSKIAPSSSAWGTIPIVAPDTSVGSLITVDTPPDSITLQVGYVYLIHVSAVLTNTDNWNVYTGRIGILNSGGTVLAQTGSTSIENDKVQGANEDNTDRVSLAVSAVVDLGSAGSDLVITASMLGNNPDVRVERGWITVQSL